MPELPEVARTALNLKEAIGNSILKEIIIHSGRYSRHGPPKGFNLLTERLPLMIEDVNFFGKLIIITLRGTEKQPWFIWNTLGMSGGWRRDKTKHGHVELKTSNGSVYFTDVRNFGTLKITDSEEETLKKIESIGPNHLHHEISDELFKERLMKSKTSTLAQALMNQNLIGGIGNYIKAEVLYRAKLSPHRTIESLSEEDFSSLNKYTREVVKTSFLRRGATIKSYADIDGEIGDFSSLFKVYGRLICESGFPVIRELTQDGRTTWWVPQIQK